MTTAPLDTSSPSYIPPKKPAMVIDKGSMAGWLIHNSSSVASKLARRILLNFSVEMLKANNMDGRSNEKPLSFTSEREFRLSLQKFNRRLLAKAGETDPSLLAATFYVFELYNTSDDSESITAHLINDEVTVRYLRYIGSLLTKKKIPLEFRLIGRDAFTARYSFQYKTRASSSPLQLYRALFHIPKFLKVINTLKRKAVYADTTLIEYHANSVAGFTGSTFTGHTD